MSMTEDDVRDVFLWAVEVVSAWSGGSPRLDKAEVALDRFFDSLRAEGYDEGYDAHADDTGLSQMMRDMGEDNGNPYRARS